MFERFTKKARQVLVEAAEEARAGGQNFVGTEHELLGLLRLGEGSAYEVLTAAGVSYGDARDASQALAGSGLDAGALESIGIDVDAVRRAVEDSFGRGAFDRAVGGKRRRGGPPFTPRAKHVLELALREALTRKQNYIGTEHILLGIIREDEGIAARVLRQLAPDADIRLLIQERLRTAW